MQTDIIIYLGADHAGFEMKEQTREFLKSRGYRVEDCGNMEFDATDDYPDFGVLVGRGVSRSGKNGAGIVFCGSGVGMCVTVNKIAGVRAASAFSAGNVQRSKQDDDTNVLCIAARMFSFEQVRDMVEKWLEAKFRSDDRYKRRIEKVRRIELAEAVRTLKKHSSLSAVIPAVLEPGADAAMEKLHLLEGVATNAQVDIMDGKFVKGKSCSLEDLNIQGLALFVEAHLMVENPEEYVEACQKAGVAKVIFHYEAAGDAARAKDIIKKIYEAGMAASVAINPETDISVLKPLAGDIESVLVLGVHPGASGQTLLEGTLGRVKELRAALPRRVSIGVDGGVAQQNVGALRQAGADTIAASSSIFGAGDPIAAYNRLSEIAFGTA